MRTCVLQKNHIHTNVFLDETVLHKRIFNVKKVWSNVKVETGKKVTEKVKTVLLLVFIITASCTFPIFFNKLWLSKLHSMNTQ